MWYIGQWSWDSRARREPRKEKGEELGIKCSQEEGPVVEVTSRRSGDEVEARQVGHFSGKGFRMAIFVKHRYLFRVL